MNFKFLILFSLIVTMKTSETTAQLFSNPESLFDPIPYGFSHLATLPSNSQLVFVAGQGGEEDKEGRLSPDFRAQVRQVLKNIEIALNTQQLDMNAVVKVTTLVVDHDENKLQIIIEEFAEVWPEKNFPVNTLIPVPKLALDNMLIEIDAIAIKK
jgi:enamine deaminase RidA (YjgF/YER057c/UK114 family)